MKIHGQFDFPWWLKIILAPIILVYLLVIWIKETWDKLWGR